MIKYVFFDFNGTLIDDCNLCLKILNWICEEYNLPNVSKRKYRSIFTFPVYNYYVALGFKVSHEDFSIIGDRFHYFYNKYSYEEVKLFKNVVRVLKTLKDKGITLICLSASMQQTLEKQLKFYEIDKYFDYIVGLSDTFARSKEEVAVNFVKSHNIDTTKALFVGDSIHDLEVANAIKAECYLLPTGHTNKKRLLEVTPNVINDLKDLLLKIQ